MAKWYNRLAGKASNFAVAGNRMAGNLWDDVTGVTAADGAARAQRDGLDKATASQEKMFNQSMDTQRPWLDAGRRGLSSLEAGINSGAFDSKLGQYKEQKYTDPTYSGPAAFQDMKFDFEADPGYKFRLAEGNREVEASAAARGGLFSGKAGIDLQNYSQGLASQEYGNAYNRFADQRDYSRSNYESDRMFGRNNFESDRLSGRQNFESDRNFGYNQFGDDFNRDRALKGDRYNRLASLAGVGQAMAGNIGNQQMDQGGNLANLAMQRGNIGAQRSMAGYQGGMNLFNTALQAGGMIAGAFGGKK